MSRLQWSLQTSVLDSAHCRITRSLIMRPCLLLVPGKDTLNHAFKNRETGSTTRLHTTTKGEMLLGGLENSAYNEYASLSGCSGTV